MPKIIDNVRERAIAEARRLMLEESYENLTIRRVAAGLGVAVGTLYNYFPSKDFLIAGVMLEDWQTIMSRLVKEAGVDHAAAATTDPAAASTTERTPITPIDRVHRVFDGIKEFSDRYSKVWAQYSGQSVRSEENMYHIQLIQQIMHLMDGVVSERAAEADPFLLEFIAENVLRFASDGRTEFSQIEGALTKLLAD
ncbi:MAG: TetR/AcrR family transcriptional regulator [Firmicutes bacterium]|nr:TetR/AcrR family transcriptional regulator [Bacillota bacterium]